MKTIYTLSILFLGFITFTAYKHYEDGVQECVQPVAQAATNDEMMRALDHECKKAKVNADVAERFHNALAR